MFSRVGLWWKIAFVSKYLIAHCIIHLHSFFIVSYDENINISMSEDSACILIPGTLCIEPCTVFSIKSMSWFVHGIHNKISVLAYERWCT